MLTPAQSRAARALLNWSQPQLAEASGTSVSTIRDFETGKRTPIANNLAAIRQALEAAGVQFIAENGGGAGVRLKRVVYEISEEEDAAITAAALSDPDNLPLTDEQLSKMRPLSESPKGVKRTLRRPKAARKRTLER